MEKTIRCTVRKKGFEYHFKKGIMKGRGGIISKHIHPIKEVEIIKNQHKLPRGE